jgi:transcriptional regulator with XRE-family HTH domain
MGRPVSKSNTMSTEIVQLIATIKRELKAQGLTYRDVARALKVSEASVKRVFASERFTVARLAEVSQLLGLTLAELLQESTSSLPPLDVLTREQEAQLVSDDKLLLVAVCSLNHWSLNDITSVYDIPKQEAVKRLRILDRLGLIELLPGDRIRRRAKRDFDWIPDGPIRSYFAKQGLNDFLEGPFNPADESLDFANGMLTRAAQAELKLELRRLRSKLVTLHEQSIPAPLSDKDGIGLLLAIRQWEPPAFRRMRRESQPDSDSVFKASQPATTIGIGLPSLCKRPPDVKAGIRKYIRQRHP